jgi:hypothetical protein
LPMIFEGRQDVVLAAAWTAQNRSNHGTTPLALPRPECPTIWATTDFAKIQFRRGPNFGRTEW